MNKAADGHPVSGFIIVLLFFCQGLHSPGSPRHSTIASCCSGVSARCRGLKCKAASLFCSWLFSIIQRCSCAEALRGMDLGK